MTEHASTMLRQALGLDIDETDPAALERRAHSLYQEALRLFERANRIRGDRSREMQRMIDERMSRESARSGLGLINRFGACA